MVTAILVLTALSSGVVYRTSQVDVTPPERLALGGYTERGDKTFEPSDARLYARTLVLEREGLRVAIVSIEALTVPESLVEAVTKRIPSDVRLMIVATHTHSAPDSQMLNANMTFKIPGIASFKRKWLDWYAEKTAQGVVDALSGTPRPADDLCLKSAEVFINHGRRKGAVPDRTATFLADDNGPVMTVYPAHATILDADNLALSGDWPGLWAHRYGGLVLPGAIGDTAPDLMGLTPVENLQIFVEKLWSGISDAQVLDLWSAAPELSFTTEPIVLGPATPHPQFSTAYGAAKPMDQMVVGRFAPKEASVSLLQIGRLLLIGVPGEPTSDVGRLIEAVARRNGFERVAVVSHCNGWIGYVLTPEDYDAGGYEATLAFHGRDLSARLVRAAETAIERLAQESERSREVQAR